MRGAVGAAGGKCVVKLGHGALPAVGAGDQRRLRGRAARERQQQLERGLVRPVQVVEHEHQPTRCREAIEQARDRPMGQVALDRGLRLTGRAQAREDRPELGAVAHAHPVETRFVDGGEVGVEGVDKYRERHLALELGGTAGQDEVTRLLTAGNQRAQKRGLADPRLPRDADQRGALVLKAFEGGVHRLELGPRPMSCSESTAKSNHKLTPRESSACMAGHSQSGTGSSPRRFCDRDADGRAQRGHPRLDHRRASAGGSAAQRRSYVATGATCSAFSRSALAASRSA